MTVKLASADHKKMITTMLDQIYQDYQTLRPDDARDFVRSFGANNWFELIKGKNWKRISKFSGGKTAASYKVIRRFRCVTQHGDVDILVTEKILTGETMPEKTVVQFEVYPSQLKPIVDHSVGATMNFAKSSDSGLKLGETNLASKLNQTFTPPPGESMLDTPKPQDFGAFA